MALAGLFLVLVLTGAGPESVLDERFGCRTAPILLLARVDVQRELQLDARQVAAAKTAIARLLDRALGLKGKKGMEVKEARRQIDLEMVEWLRRNLSGPQYERLFQVDLQWEGAAAMTRDHVVATLQLSDRQRIAINRLLDQLEATRRTRRILSPPEIGQFAGGARAVLTPAQREVWDRLLGKPCHFLVGGRSVTTPIGSDPEVVRTKARPDR